MPDQQQRDRQAIRTVLEASPPLHQATSQEIALRAGEGLYTALFAMVADGEVERIQLHSRAPILYRLTQPNKLTSHAKS